jgi:Pyridoxamine 5'-phosphate oxidase
VPIWFVLDNGNSKEGKVGNIIFATGDRSVKANNIQLDNRVSICVDDLMPPFSFITIYGTKNTPLQSKRRF